MLAQPCLRDEPDIYQEFASSEAISEEDLLCAFDKARGEIFGKLYRMLGNYQDAQDALQIAFMHCWRARERLPELHNLKAWIWRVALNAGRDLRDLVWRRRAKPLSLVEATASCYRTSAADNLVDQECLERVQAALPNLRPEEREVFNLRQDRSLTYEEIGRERNIPVGTAKTLMRKAMTKLRRALQDDLDATTEEERGIQGRIPPSRN